MLETIITYLNQQLGTTKYYTQSFGLSEKITKDDTKTAMFFCEGEWQTTTVFSENKGTSYWRKLSETSTEIENTIGCEKLLEISYDLRLVSVVRNDHLEKNDAYTSSIAAQTVSKKIIQTNRTLKTTLKARKFNAQLSSVDTDRESIMVVELEGVDKQDLDYKYSFFTVDFNIVVWVTETCLLESCDTTDYLCDLISSSRIQDVSTCLQALPASSIDIICSDLGCAVGDLCETISSADINDVITCLLALPAGDQSAICTGLACPGTGGLLFNELPLLSVDTSYANYDYRWHLDNGTYSRTQTTPGVPVKLTDFFTVDQSIWAHFFRLTGLYGGYYDEGTTSYKDKNGVASIRGLAFPDEYMVDNYTYLGYSLLAASSGWALALIDPTTTLNGKTGWRLASPIEQDIILDYSNNIGYNYSPFEFSGTDDYWTNVTHHGNTTQALTVDPSNKRGSEQGKATTNDVIYSRNHDYVTDTPAAPAGFSYSLVWTNTANTIFNTWQNTNELIGKNSGADLWTNFNPYATTGITGDQELETQAVIFGSGINMMWGLWQVGAVNDFTDIDFTFYINSSKQLSILEKGVFKKTNFAVVGLTDVMKIEYTSAAGGTIEYFLNGISEHVTAGVGLGLTLNIRHSSLNQGTYVRHLKHQ